MVLNTRPLDWESNALKIQNLNKGCKIFEKLSSSGLCDSKVSVLYLFDNMVTIH